MKKKKIENRLIEIEVDCYDFSDPVEFHQLKDFIIEAEALGVTHLKFYGSSDYDGDCSDVTITGVLIREETDNEYNERIQEDLTRELNRKAQMEQKERDLLAQLKEKYETKH